MRPILKTISLFILLAAGITVSPARLAAQCNPFISVDIYTDAWFDQGGFDAFMWSGFEDNSTFCGCTDSLYQSVSWMQLPNGTYWNNAENGLTSFLSGPTLGINGNYWAIGSANFYSSCLGEIYVNSDPDLIPLPPPLITGIIDYATGSNTVYPGDSSYFEIYGYALTAGGQIPTPSVWGDSDVTINFVSYASDNQVNVSYTVAANPAMGPHTISLQTVGAIAAFQIRVAAPPKPRIQMNGTDITGTTQTVTVGQQIIFSGAVTGGTFTNPIWTIGGSWVGGFVPSLNGPGLVPQAQVSMSAQNLVSIYFSYAGTSSVQFQVTGATGKIFSVTATLTVRQPNATTGHAQLPATGIVVDTACGSPFLRYGGCPGYTAGMSFTVTGDPSFGGSYEWIQVVISANAAANGAPVVNCSGGIDSTLPYSTSAATSDSPRVPVAGGNTEYTANESFQMFLMYQPSSANAIFVPLIVIGVGLDSGCYFAKWLEYI